ncbi:MAG: ATP-dependent RecD-like DNA helicase [Ruminococcus sp.]|nr:ATP-dependent RecD-like DNA helicase [Ruminococcus sp.]
MTDNKDLIKITGEVDVIRHRSDNGDFTVIMLASEGKLITVVGDLGDVEEGEEITCTGSYVSHSRYGMQFRCELCERSLPNSPSGMKRYLASGVIEGLGPATARKIVERFGENTFDILEKDPEQLAEINGISQKQAQEYSKQFRKTFEVRAVMNELAQYSVPARIAIKAWKHWGEKTTKVVLSNPYLLTGESLGLPFPKADSIAYQLEMPRSAHARLAAGIKVSLKGFENKGHTAVPFAVLVEDCCRLLAVDRPMMEKAVDEEAEAEELYIISKGHDLFVMSADCYKAEFYIARRLSVMAEISYDNQVDFSDVIDIAEEENGLEYAETQRQAINLALSKGFLVLTGGPGTGKTTTLNAILSLYEQQGLNVMLAAPTGRAAKRLSDLTGHEAKTIHRLLEVKNPEGDYISFVHDDNDPLDCDVLILDEMSMVDSRLFEAVLRAVSVTCKLVLVGDSDQLPSVGAGNVLKDIIDSGVMPVITLTEIFRQAQQSLIVTTAHKIVRGEMPDLSDRSGDFFFMQRNTFPLIQQLTVSLCKERLPGYYGIDPMNDIQVISPTRQGPCGTVELNRLLQQELNPPATGKSEVHTALYTFRKGDKVMQTRNNYDILWKRTDDKGHSEEGAGIFNGDIGVIVGANSYLKTITIDFDGRVACFEPEMLEDLELAYAITVHKSQGSEFDYVVMTMFEGFDRLCYRNLLYTGVTRAKKVLIIVGQIEQFGKMIHNVNSSVRCTALKEMLLQNASGSGFDDDEL